MMKDLEKAQRILNMLVAIHSAIDEMDDMITEFPEWRTILINYEEEIDDLLEIIVD